MEVSAGISRERRSASSWVGAVMVRVILLKKHECQSFAQRERQQDTVGLHKHGRLDWATVAVASPQMLLGADKLVPGGAGRLKEQSRGETRWRRRGRREGEERTQREAKRER